MADNFSPFNNQPASTVYGTGSYTVPAGQYARVTFFMQASMIPSIDNAPAIGNFIEHQPNGSSENKEITLWLKAGDDITTNLVNGSTSVVAANSTTSLISTAVCSFLINGNSFDLKASGSIIFTRLDATARTLRLTGSTSIQYHVELYNNQGS